MYLFAGDAKLFRAILEPEDCNKLQQDIHVYNIQAWTDKWLLCFHPDKCKVIRIGKLKINKKQSTLKPNEKKPNIC